MSEDEDEDEGRKTDVPHQHGQTSVVALGQRRQSRWKLICRRKPRAEKLPATSPKGELVADLTQHGQQFVLCKGGRGGLGNRNFATAARQTPRFAQPGEPGEEGDFLFELRIMAEVGLVGYPNAGKSTLLTAISKARPKVAPYPFTTLHPQIGIVEYADWHRLTVCDVPGLIEGAHQNVGLGHAFLRHIERCKIIVLLLDMAGTDNRAPWDDYKQLLKELELYDPALLERPRLVVANKMDEPVAEENLKQFKKKIRKVSLLPISAAFDQGIEKFKQTIREAVEKRRSEFVAVDVSDRLTIMQSRWQMRLLRRLLQFKKPHHAVAVLEQFHLLPGRDNVQRVAFGVAEHKSSAGREQLRQDGIVQQLLRKGGGAAADVFFSVRRVGQDQIELPSAVGQLAQDGKDILRADFQNVAITGRLRVAADEFGVPVRFLNAKGRGRAAAQTLQAQRAGTGKQLQHPRAGDPRAQAVEDRLLDQVGRRADVESLGNLENPPSRVAAGDAHCQYFGGTSYTSRTLKSILKFGARVTRPSDLNHLKISARNCFMASHERLSAFSL